MIIKNRQIVEFMNGIQELKNKKLPVKLGYAILKNERILESCAVGYEQERHKILEQYVAKDEDGEFIVKDNHYDIADLKGFGEELNSLMEIENEVNLHTVNYGCIEQCGTGQYDALSINDIEALEIMLQE